MKTKLLKKVRKRYVVKKVKVEDWMKKSTNRYFARCWHETMGEYCYTLS